MLGNICATETKGEDNELVAYGECGEDCDNIGTSQNGEWMNIMYTKLLEQKYALC